tara:strand:+ start:282 stop:881 length:600 start_codon:yes stop_codon:yes gene_type:complete
MMNLTETMSAIQFKLKAPKGQFNSFGKYSYRSQEDILEAVKPLLSKHKLTMRISDSVEEVAGTIIINSCVCVSNGDETFSVTAQAGVDINRKGMDIAQSFGSSSSYARKYALNGMFLIDDTKDSDSSNTHGKSAKELYTKAAAPKAAPKTAQAESKDSYAKALDYVTASSNRAQALKLVMSKYEADFTPAQKKNLNDLA